MSTIRLPIYNIVIKGNSITSDLTEAGLPTYEAAMNTIESMILAHHCAGVDVTAKEYVEGIQTAVDAVVNYY